MAETENIARMAESVSDEIFSAFGWRRSGPVNLSWPCVTPGHHKTNHPTDVVFQYDDPYSNQRVYLNVDLKSFSTKTITKQEIGGALRSMVLATECANKSPEWVGRYVDPDVASQVVGLLFLYNHDDKYAYDLSRLVEAVDDRNFDLAAHRRVCLIDPVTISYLYTIATDISALRGRNQIPGQADCRFFYPDLVQFRARQAAGEAASLEMLTGPWQIIRFSKPATSAGRGDAGDGYLVYYRGQGSTVWDFHHLFDHFFHYQMLSGEAKILLRMPFAHRDAAAFFERAVEGYGQRFGLDDIVVRLKRIKFSTIKQVRSTFSDVELGMRNE